MASDKWVSGFFGTNYSLNPHILRPTWRDLMERQIFLPRLFSFCWCFFYTSIALQSLLLSWTVTKIGFELWLGAYDLCLFWDFWGRFSGPVYLAQTFLSRWNALVWPRHFCIHKRGLFFSMLYLGNKNYKPVLHLFAWAKSVWAR